MSVLFLNLLLLLLACRCARLVLVYFLGHGLSLDQ